MKNQDLEFDFDVNVREAISDRLPAFKNLCKRYPNNTDLGAKLRDLTNEFSINKSQQSAIYEYVLLMSMASDIFIDKVFIKKR